MAPLVNGAQYARQSGGELTHSRNAQDVIKYAFYKVYPRSYHTFARIRASLAKRDEQATSEMEEANKLPEGEPVISEIAKK